MKATRTSITWCIALFAFSLFATAASGASISAEVAAIHAVDQVWVKSYNGGNADAVASLYDERAVLLPPGAAAVNGRAAIRAFFAQDMASSAKDGLAFSLGTKPDGGVSGDLGWASGTYTVKDRSGRVVDTGKYLSVSRKKGGKWLYIRDTWNSDGASPSPPDATTKK